MRVSTLATIIVSVRVPRRSGPASLPTSSTFNRALPIASAAGVPPLSDGNSRSSSCRWELASSAPNPSGAATVEAQHRDDPGAEHALPGAQPRRPGEQVGPDDDGHPGQRGHQQPDRAADEGARREQGAEEVRPVGAQRQHEQREQAEHERRHDRRAGAEPAQGEVPGAGDERRQRRGEQRGAERGEPADLRAPGRVEPQLLGGGPVVADGRPLHRPRPAPLRDRRGRARRRRPASCAGRRRAGSVGTGAVGRSSSTGRPRGGRIRAGLRWAAGTGSAAGRRGRSGRRGRAGSTGRRRRTELPVVAIGGPPAPVGTPGRPGDQAGSTAHPTPAGAGVMTSVTPAAGGCTGPGGPSGSGAEFPPDGDGCACAGACGVQRSTGRAQGRLRRGPCSSTLVTPWSSSRRYLRIRRRKSARGNPAPQRLPGSCRGGAPR